MKYIFIFFLLFLVSCSINNKTYMCGDRACIDNKEFKEYFAKNLIVEIKNKKSKKNYSLDLVKLNTTDKNKSKSKKMTKNVDNKQKKKDDKALFKAKKNKLKEERRIKKINDKKLAKLKKINKKNNKDITINTTKKNKFLIDSVKKPTKITNQIIDDKKLKRHETFRSIRSKNQISVCKKIKDCNIDKIAELLIKKGKKKDFPNITSK